ncbi:CHAT domain-containing protein [Mycena vulgaris]|nr:CHAT domain-containing protein [Mycena vulgaris]
MTTEATVGLPQSREVPGPASDAFRLADSMMRQSTMSRNFSSLDTAIYLIRNALYRLLCDRQDLSICVPLFAKALLTRFLCTGGSEEDADLAFVSHLYKIQAGTEHFVTLEALLGMINAPTLVDPEIDDSVEDLMSCASAIVDEFHQSVDLATLDTGIALYRTVLSFSDQLSPLYWKSLFDLSTSLVTRYHRTGDSHNIAHSLTLLRRLLRVRPNRIMCLVAALLLSGPDATHVIAAFKLSQISLQAQHKAKELYESGQKHWDSFSSSGNPADLRKAVSDFEAAEEQYSWGADGRPSLLSQLANARLELCVQTSDIKGLDAVIELQCEAIRLYPDSKTDRGMLFYNLGRAFFRRFTQSGAATDLYKSICVITVALHLLQARGIDRSSVLTAMGFALHERFELKGDLADLDAAITFHRRAFASAQIPNDRATALNNLGRALLERFVQGGEAAVHDLDAAIIAHDEALSLRPSPHPARSVSLNNLAQCYNERFRRGNKKSDLDRAITLHREALALRQPGHLERVATLSNLAASLQSRFLLSENLADLSEAIQMHRDCLEIRKHTHVDRSASLQNLASCLDMQSQHTKNPRDLDNAMDAIHEALKLLNVQHPERFHVLTGLARSLFHKYGFTQNSKYLDQAFKALCEASTSTHFPVVRRFATSTHWCIRADEYHHASALQAYSTALELLPQMAMLGLDLESRHKALTSGSDGLACGAAECAVGQKDLPKAVEFLEAGRSVFWSQALQLRSPLHGLERADPELAKNVAELFKQLEGGSYRDIHSVRKFPPQTAQHMEFDAQTKYYRKLNSDLVNAIRDVRRLDGFQDFLLPKRFSALRASARNGPVVILNVSTASSTALIITVAQDVQAVPLPEMTRKFAMILVYLLRKRPRGVSLVPSHIIPTEYFGRNGEESSTCQTRLIGRLEGSKDLNPEQIFEMVLSNLWISVVEPVVRALNLKKSANPPRLWWCPTGPLAFLPIHAAGLYGIEGTNCISQYAISSYTPTLAALLDPGDSKSTPFKMTAIIQPTTPYLISLPGTRGELSTIEARVPGKWLTTLGRASDTTVEIAMAHLRESTIVHFACHGTQDFTNPLKSGLVLADGILEVQQIMRKIHGETPAVGRMSLAFLSACETAKGDDTVPDEAMHLAACLLFAGFRGVIGTMWTMGDPDGPKVADTFYHELFRTSDAESDPPVPPDLTRAAHALHHSILKLREDPNVPFMRWVPFVHYGL